MMKERHISASSQKPVSAASRIHISKSKSPHIYSTQHYLSLTAQPPPRPPCWQDFTGKNIHSRDRQDPYGSNLSLAVSSTSDTDKKPKTLNPSHRSKNRKATSLKSKGISTSGSQSKLKRTRSEPCILEKEIPAEVGYTVRLTANQLARQSLTANQLARQSMDECKRYLEDTYNKCSKWLEQITPVTVAKTPLEDADFETGSGDLITCEDETSEVQTVKRHSLALDKIPE